MTGHLPDYEQSEMMGGEGWRALGWSFVSSGAMTVRTPDSQECEWALRGSVGEFLVSGHICYTGL